MQEEALNGLRLLAARCAHLWPSGTVEEVVSIAEKSSSDAVISRCLDVLQVLASSSAACHSHLCHGRGFITLDYFLVNPTAIFFLNNFYFFKIYFLNCRLYFDGLVQ